MKLEEVRGSYGYGKVMKFGEIKPHQPPFPSSSNFINFF
jgi:hypothetical protein